MSRDFDKEVRDYVSRLPEVKTSELNIGDTFIIAHEGYSCVFGFSGFDLNKVNKKTPATIKYSWVSDEVGFNTQLSTRSSGRLFRRATNQDVAHVKRIREEEKEEEARSLRMSRRALDKYILWNRAFEGDEPDIREGFLIEVYNGNGTLLERVRMLCDNSEGMDEAHEDAVERMVEAYVSHMHPDLDDEHDRHEGQPVFQICYAKEID